MLQRKSKYSRWSQGFVGVRGKHKSTHHRRETDEASQFNSRNSVRNCQAATLDFEFLNARDSGHIVLSESLVEEYGSSYRFRKVGSRHTTTLELRIRRTMIVVIFKEQALTA